MNPIVLDITAGRKTRSIPHALRRMLHCRDRLWADGGETHTETLKSQLTKATAAVLAPAPERFSTRLCSPPGANGKKAASISSIGPSPTMRFRLVVPKRLNLNEEVTVINEL